MKLTNSEINQAISLIDDLFWEWDRISSSGRESLNSLAEVFKMEEHTDG